MCGDCEDKLFVFLLLIWCLVWVVFSVDLLYILVFRGLYWFFMVIVCISVYLIDVMLCQVLFIVFSNGKRVVLVVL